MKVRLLIPIGLVAGLLVTAMVTAVAAPMVVNYQGILTDAEDEPINGVAELIFAIYPDSLPQTDPLWTEAYFGVEINNGLFNVLLGSIVPFPDGLFGGGERWLGMQVDQDPEIRPLMLIASVPWALHAAVADTALTSMGGSDNDWIINGNNMYAAPSGNVGIGVTNPSTKLYISASSRGLYSMTASGTTWAIKGSNDPTGNHGEVGGPTYGVHGEPGNGSNFGELGTEDYGVLGEHGHGHIGYFASNALGAYGEHSNGNKGSLGSGDYGVYGEHNNGSYGYLGSTYYGVYGEHDTQFGVAGNSENGTGVRGGTFNGVGVKGVDYNSGNWGSLGSSSFGISGYSGVGTAVKGVSPQGLAGFFDGDLWVQNGRLTTPVIEITGGSDLSEQFSISASSGGLEPAPGMLVSLDVLHPGSLVVSSHAYDKRVAGVISGAGGVRPGLLMGQKGSLADGATPVALTGRVYCWADASYGSIEPGDFLTTSSTAGHAMKAADHDRAYGAVIGKAMTNLASGRGLVLVLVNLQ
jgi:hypothetical protein